MKIISLKCPECGASIQVEDDRDKCFCTYCGTQLYLDDGAKREVHEHIYREVDEARIKEAELELEKQKLNWMNSPKGFAGTIVGFLIIYIVLMVTIKFLVS